MEIVESGFQLILTGRIGDGHFIVNDRSQKASVMYVSINKEYIIWKRNILSKNFICGNVYEKDNSAGFNKNGRIYTVYAHASEKIYKYGMLDKVSVIDSLDYFGFMVYYFDDGAWHKNRKIMHLYCNSFNDTEVEHLRRKMFDLFGGKLPSIYYDKKKDGRKYPYLYIPKIMTEAIIDSYKYYVEENIPSMLYKLGLPSQTTESQQKC